LVIKMAIGYEQRIAVHDVEKKRVELVEITDVSVLLKQMSIGRTNETVSFSFNDLPTEIKEKFIPDGEEDSDIISQQANFVHRNENKIIELLKAKIGNYDFQYIRGMYKHVGFTVEYSYIVNENYSSTIPKLDKPINCNSGINNAFVGTVYFAYANHLPLRLRVEDFWIQIMSIFSRVIDEDPEKYRTKLVDWLDKKDIIVEDCSNDIQNFIEALKNKLADSNEFTKKMTQPFSGSTDMEKLVINAMCLESLKEFCNYGMMPICGIPYVILEGTVDDYQELLNRTMALHEIAEIYHCNFGKLIDTLNKLIETKKGNIDIEWWWKKICSLDTLCGGFLDGWITYFSNSGMRPDLNIPILTNIHWTDLSTIGQSTKHKIIAGLFGTNCDPEKDHICSVVKGYIDLTLA